MAILSSKLMNEPKDESVPKNPLTPYPPKRGLTN